MKTIIKTISLICLSALTGGAFAGSDDNTYKRYQALSTSIKEKPAKVLAFIEEDNYLSDRLRKKYLTHLYKHKKWQDFLELYIATGSDNQYCQYLTAYYHQKNKQLALKKLSVLWQKPKALAKSCNKLVNIWQAGDSFDESLRFQKFKALMLAKKVSLAKKMIREMNESDKRYAKMWLQVDKSPYKIKTPKNLADPRYKDIIAYALRTWARKSPDGAVAQWAKLKDQYSLNSDHQQIVFETAALYAALRNNDKAESYFQKLDLKKTPTLHHEWRARNALRQENWGSLNEVITNFPQELQEKECWQYWLARSHEKLGNQQKADLIYKALAKNRQYYGFLASFKINAPVQLNEKNYEYDDELISKHRETIKEIERLYKDKKIQKASLLSYELSNSLSEEELYLFAKELSKFNWYHKALYYTNKSKHLDDLNIRFPLGYQELIEENAEDFNIEAAFIYAIIRQESTFRKEVKSHAGALGLMQVIPSTARRMSKQYNVPLKTMKHMYKPKTNVKIGTAYLKHLKKQFNGHPILMAAAYNAGPTQVRRWLREHSVFEADRWIETLPWHETRNYLKNVMSFLTIYQARLGKDNTPLWIDPIKTN